MHRLPISCLSSFLLWYSVRVSGGGWLSERRKKGKRRRKRWPLTECNIGLKDTFDQIELTGFVAFSILIHQTTRDSLYIFFHICLLELSSQLWKKNTSWFANIFFSFWFFFLPFFIFFFFFGWLEECLVLLLYFLVHLVMVRNLALTQTLYINNQKVKDMKTGCT